MKTRLYLLSLLLLTSCAARQPVQMSTLFDQEEHGRYLNVGTRYVSGQAFLRQMNGGTITCGGNQVVLLPDTSFMREAIAHFKNGDKVELNDAIPQKYSEVVKVTRCDAQGNFRFTQIAAENWLVLTDVTWFVPGRYMSTKAGGMLWGKFDLSKGSLSNVIMSDHNMLRSTR